PSIAAPVTPPGRYTAAAATSTPYTTSSHSPTNARTSGIHTKITVPTNAPIHDRDPPTMMIVNASTTRWKLMSSGVTDDRSRTVIDPDRPPSTPLTANVARR